MPYADAETAIARKSEWDRRIRRAADLAQRFAFAKEVLAFYGEVLRLQRDIFNSVSHPATNQANDGPIRLRLDVVGAARHLPALLALAEKKGTAKLVRQAREVGAASHERQVEMLQTCVAGEPSDADFFARALLQPYAEWLAATALPARSGPGGSVCPWCGARPQAAVLRPEGDGGKRFLLCSLCLTEWEFRRILCPVCGEENHQKLPRYSAEDFDAVRVEACDTCGSYMKSVDMTVDGLAVPVVDEVASVPLDLWATEHGYKKNEPNLMGF